MSYNDKNYDPYIHTKDFSTAAMCAGVHVPSAAWLTNKNLKIYIDREKEPMKNDLKRNIQT